MVKKSIIDGRPYRLFSSGLVYFYIIISTSLGAFYGAITEASELYVGGFHTDNVLRYEANTSNYLGEFIGPGSGGLEEPFGLAFGPDGHLYVSGVNNSAVLRYNGLTGAYIDEFVQKGSGGLDKVTDIAFGPDGLLYVGDNSQSTGDKVLRYDGLTGEFIDSLPGIHAHFNQVAYLTFGPDGNLYISGSGIGRFNFDTGSPETFFNHVTSQQRAIAFGKDGNAYVTVGDGNTPDGSVWRFHGETGEFIDEFISPDGSGKGLFNPHDLLFDPAGDLYIAASSALAIHRYDGATGNFVEVLGENINFPSGLTMKPIPIPGAVWLLGSGLIALVGLRRKLKKD
jgi:glucose/arabinose dehydrogenase